MSVYQLGDQVILRESGLRVRLIGRSWKDSHFFIYAFLDDPGSEVHFPVTDTSYHSWAVTHRMLPWEEIRESKIHWNFDEAFEGKVKSKCATCR